MCENTFAYSYTNKKDVCIDKSCTLKHFVVSCIILQAFKGNVLYSIIISMAIWDIVLMIYTFTHLSTQLQPQATQILFLLINF